MQGVIDQIVARRIQLGISKEAVAVHAGVHSNTVIQFEKGNRAIGVDSLARIATALSCRIVLEPIGAHGVAPGNVAAFMEGT